MIARFARFACLLLPLVAACGGIDATQLSGRHNTVVSEDPTTPADADAAAETAAAADGGASETEAGATDGGADADAGSTPPPPVNAFTGASAFVSQLGPTTRQTAHNFPGNTPTTSPKGQACSNCHSFFMGGTIFADAAGTMPAAGVEVRARNAAGTAVSAWTDQDGNFYMPTSGGVAFPASVGVRNAATTKVMSASLGAGTCAASACHVTGKQGPIHLP